MSDLVRIQPEHVSLETGHGTLEAREIKLGGVPRGMVLLLCDPGALDSDAVDIMNDCAEHGYESLAVELDGSDGAAGADGAGGTGHMALQALLARARGREWDNEQIAVIGLGMGGRAALAAAASLELAASVSFSPTVSGDGGDDPTATALDQLVETVRTPWLGLFGARDRGAPDGEVRSLAQRLRRGTDVYTHVVTYPGVGRDFHRQVGDGVSYAASYDAWERTFEWLNARVAPRLTPLAREWRQRHPANA